ncbi:electron transfer flavoprotein subunit beta/FixA family protein [Halorhodospira halochloris]|uniref:electron transfer flavoprotein subunit beta/FixA family protein n=1 Tax=Halorhodospira halochloris TaxID=1052 RepID=UPI001EE7CB7A|nr:electron transfer flavoprotein subunit beta/FixA family protein [Halorhodospira halochloris]MCG5547936.1 electron transfer flavoprotein subunit beta/FixA family protein [Halorhodospira halochloris]
MKILVTAKRVIDPNIRVQVLPDGSAIAAEHAKKTLNPFDEVAIEQAVRMKEAGHVSEIIAVTIGTAGAEEVLRTALAFGVDRALLIGAEHDLEPLAVSRVLAELIEREEPDWVLMGKQASDDDSNQTGQMLAQRLGWGQATFACALSLVDGELHVTREVDGGKKTLAVKPPAVVTADLGLNEPRYIKLPNLMKAKKKPIERLELDDLGVDVSPRFEQLGLAEPQPRQGAGIRVESAEELVAKLRDEGQL